MALTDNLQAFYKLSDLSDSSGNNRTLTNNGNVSFASGKIGNAAVFDGSNELEGNFQIPFSDSATVSLWFNLNSIDEESTLFGIRNYPTPTVNLAIQPNGQVWLNDYTYPQMSSDEGVVSTNNWYHVCFKTEGANMSLYINGSLIQTSQSTLATVGQFFIGSGSNINYFDGQIDAVGIWNRALSDAEVAELYNNGTGLELEVQAPVVDLEDGLQAFYKLSDLSDSSGNNRTLTNNGNVSFASGKIGNAAVFDESNNLELQENLLALKTEFTVSSWVKTADNDAYVLACGGLEGILVVNEGGLFTFNASTGYSPIQSSQYVNDDSWHHLVATFNNGSVKLYVDGVMDGTGETDSVVPDSNSSKTTIGQQPNDSWASFVGQIDAVGIWNRALSDAEVAELYNNGTGLELDGPAVKNGWIDNIFWINDVATTLDQNGDGTWVGKLYENGSLFSGSKYSLTFVDGVAQAEQIVTVIGSNIPVAFGLNEAEEPLVELVFSSITSAGETTVEQIVPTVLPSGYTVAETILAYSIDTTATFEGSINVDFILPSNISQAVFDRVKGFHVKNSGAIEEMARVSSDFSTKRITVAITSFSDFLFLDEPQVNKSVKVVGKSKFVGKVKFA